MTDGQDLSHEQTEGLRPARGTSVIRVMSQSVRLAKVRLSILLRLFVDYSFVRSLIFCIFENQGHFRGARSGVYMVIGETDSVIRFGFL